jgi:hypothetical protein
MRVRIVTDGKRLVNGGATERAHQVSLDLDTVKAGDTNLILAK